MGLYELSILNFILLMFPMLLYFVYQTYSKTLNKNKNEFYLDVALISSFYLVICYGMNTASLLPFLLINIPLIIAYIKKRYLSSIFLSVMIILNYYDSFEFNIMLLIIEYSIYYLLFLYGSKGKKSYVIYIVLVLKCICFFLHLTFIKQPFNMDWLLVALIFFISTYFLGILLNLSENVIKLYKSIKELEEEKQIRDSLFKITHEIKNPIAVCKGYLDMFDVNNVEHSRKYVPILKDEIKRVLTLLQDFLSITKIKVEKDIVDIYMLIEDVVDSFEPLLNDKKITMTLNIPDDELYIMADYNRVSQVLLNLIKNSIEAIDDKEGVIEIECNETKNKIKICITDNGCGIAEENLKHMNEPFFTTKQNGTGLGVYLSREIIKEHNGDITYTSSSNGTCATIWLPKMSEKKGY